MCVCLCVFMYTCLTTFHFTCSPLICWQQTTKKISIAHCTTWFTIIITYIHYQYIHSPLAKMWPLKCWNKALHAYKKFWFLFHLSWFLFNVVWLHAVSIQRYKAKIKLPAIYHDYTTSPYIYIIKTNKRQSLHCKKIPLFFDWSMLVYEATSLKWKLVSRLRRFSFFFFLTLYT